MKHRPPQKKAGGTWRGGRCMEDHRPQQEITGALMATTSTIPKRSRICCMRGAKILWRTLQGQLKESVVTEKWSMTSWLELENTERRLPRLEVIRYEDGRIAFRVSCQVLFTSFAFMCGYINDPNIFIKWHGRVISSSKCYWWYLLIWLLPLDVWWFQSISLPQLEYS